MKISTRCNFKNFSLTWLSVTDIEDICPTERYPKLNENLIQELHLEKGIEWSMSAFLLEAENKKALFDTGFHIKELSGIPQRLKELKISPNQIDYIFITHSHWDHIEGLIDEKDNIIYPNAKIYISKEEYNSKLKKVKPDKVGLYEKIKKICEKQIIQFDFEDKLPLGIIPIKAFGHTPGHTCYRKDELLIIGDLIHAEKLQFKHPEISSVFDNDENLSIESRKKILKYAEENKLLLAGHHLPNEHSGMYLDFYKK